MGNRLQKVDSGSGTENYTYNAANMLLTRGTTAYTNDIDGKTLTGEGRANTWDSQNRLVQCVNNGNTASYVYGSDGLRRRATVGTVTTDFALDGDAVVREIRGGVNYATYLTGAQGPCYRRDDVGGSVRWYLYDGLGSVLGEVDPTGNLTSTRTFDVYGATRTSTGTHTSKHGYVGQLGHPSEDETGLTYMRARYYDPAVGRFISEDQKHDGGNWFEYARSAPTTRVDRTGHFVLELI